MNVTRTRCHALFVLLTLLVTRYEIAVASLLSEIARKMNDLSIDDWHWLKSNYSQALQAKSERLNDKKKRELYHLDSWYQEVLAQSIQGRKERYITHNELCKLMKWKLTRGKFRPRLEQLVQTNSEDDVITASRKAFKLLPNLSEAIKALSVLKAIGPATASAVLAVDAAFMADESMLPGLSPLAYTPAFYDRYMEQVKSLVKKLNKEDDKKWTAHDVELALWTYQILKTLEPDVLKTNIGSEARISKKRKRDVD